jgi:hypothetical protein
MTVYIAWYTLHLCLCLTETIGILGLAAVAQFVGLALELGPGEKLSEVVVLEAVVLWHAGGRNIAAIEDKPLRLPTTVDIASCFTACSGLGSGERDFAIATFAPVLEDP